MPSNRPDDPLVGAQVRWGRPDIVPERVWRVRSVHESSAGKAVWLEGFPLGVPYDEVTVVAEGAPVDSYESPDPAVRARHMLVLAKDLLDNAFEADANGHPSYDLQGTNQAHRHLTSGVEALRELVDNGPLELQRAKGHIAALQDREMPGEDHAADVAHLIDHSNEGWRQVGKLRRETESLLDRAEKVEEQRAAAALIVCRVVTHDDLDFIALAGGDDAAKAERVRAGLVEAGFLPARSGGEGSDRG